MIIIGEAMQLLPIIGEINHFFHLMNPIAHPEKAAEFPFFAQTDFVAKK